MKRWLRGTLRASYRPRLVRLGDRCAQVDYPKGNLSSLALQAGAGRGRRKNLHRQGPLVFCNASSKNVVLNVHLVRPDSAACLPLSLLQHAVSSKLGVRAQVE